MKKLLIFLLLFLFIFASSASATIYSWVDEKGVVNFADDYSKVPPEYRDKVKEVNIQKMGPSTPPQPSPGKVAVSPQSRKATTAPPPIGQTLIREGDFAVKLTEVLKVGRPQNEAEAENMLSSVGVTPKNGWIADYPMTPNIIGELQNAIGTAADSGKLGMKKDEAMKTFQDLTAQQGLPIRADTEAQNAGTEQPPEGVAPPQNYPEYYEPSAINNYYYDQGPPIVTYYPPPWDYYYLYAWVPYPFWCGGFWFPGFFCLHDFHRGFFVNGNQRFISNHFWDSRTRGFGTIDPAGRYTGNAMANTSHPAGGFSSRQASNGASSILRRSSGNTVSNRSTGAIPGNRGRKGPSNLRGGVSATRPSMGYSRSGGVQFGRSTYGSSSSHPGMGAGRSFSLPSSGGSSGFHGGGFGSRGFSGGGGRGFSGGSVRGGR
jgi:hypothetical protein